MNQARRQPGQVSYASAGVGNVLHLAGEMLAQQAGVQLLHVPYKGAAPALNDLAAGQVNFMFNSALAVAPMVKDGRIRLLAQTGTGYLLGQARAQEFRNGFFDQTVQLWNEAGAMLATSHQIVYYKE